MFDERVDAVLKEVCLEISERYELKFLEIGTDKDHVHFLVQSVPTLQRDKDSADGKEHYGSGFTAHIGALAFRVGERLFFRNSARNRAFQQAARENSQNPASP